MIVEEAEREVASHLNGMADRRMIIPEMMGEPRGHAGTAIAERSIQLLGVTSRKGSVWIAIVVGLGHSLALQSHG